LFTKYWEKCIKDQGVTIPTHVLEHGFNKDTYFPVPTELARRYFGIKDDDFIVLNLNRNQPRKRWDICIKAWAELVSRLPNEPIKLLIGTEVNGAWNLMDIYERELKKRDLTMEVGMKHVILLDNPQSLSDTDINVLYNATDMGLTTCDGEGWGLCSFEQAAVGVPQVAPRLGGFLEFFDDDNATLVQPVMSLYIDSSRDAVGGEAQLCNYVDFTEAIETQYQMHKQAGKGQTRDLSFRKRVITEYSWDTIGTKLVGILRQVLGLPTTTLEESILVDEPLPVIIEEDEVIPIIDASDISDVISIDGTIEAPTTVEYVTKSEFEDLNKKIDAIFRLLSSPTEVAP